LLAGQFVHVATGSVGFILVMVGRTGWDMAVYAGSLLLDLALAFWLCPRYGIEGAAIANAITFACSNAVRLLLVRRFVSIQPYDRDYSRLLAPTVLAGGVMWLVHETIAAGPLVDLALTGGLGGAAYGLVYLAVGLTPAERRGAAALLGTFRGRRHRGGA
ncbi:MAG: polysaccharide biosynthesis C-terminal domain-containing protein, partial [Actinomycetota bacterium]